MAQLTQEQIVDRIFGDRYKDRGAPIWDAFEQGQYARAIGWPRDRNPWDHPSLPWHINVDEWYRGWDKGV